MFLVKNKVCGGPKCRQETAGCHRPENFKEVCFDPYIIFSKNPSSRADVTWRTKHCFSARNNVQRPQHGFLAKLWHKNDVFDEKNVCRGPKCQPETTRLTSPREFSPLYGGHHTKVPLFLKFTQLIQTEQFFILHM